MKNFLGYAWIAIFSVLLSGCTYEEASHRIQTAWNDLTGSAPRKPVQPASAASPTVEGQKLKQNTELLREVFVVVLLREPYTQEFNGFVNTLSQGASIEGLYNGFVNSDYYRNLEEKGAPADAAAIRRFSDLLLSFEGDLASSHAPVTDFDIGPPPYSTERFQAAFRTASLFRLKHVLGNEALKVMEAKGGPSGKDREALADWYSGWAARMAAFGVDFGLKLRNNSDRDFHKNWALSLPADLASDRIVWEVLNRVHRLLNAAEAKANGGSK